MTVYRVTWMRIAANELVVISQWIAQKTRRRLHGGSMRLKPMLPRSIRFLSDVLQHRKQRKPTSMFAN